MDRTILLLTAGLHQAMVLTGVEGGTHYVPPSLFVIGFSLFFFSTANPRTDNVAIKSTLEWTHQISVCKKLCLLKHRKVKLTS